MDNIFELEIDIASKKFEHCLESVSSMDNILMLESEGDGNTFSDYIKKIIEALKKLVNDVKENVKKKVHELQMKFELKKIEKNWIDRIDKTVVITNFSEEKEIVKLFKDAIVVMRKGLSDIASAKDIEKCEKICKDVIFKTDNIEDKIYDLSKDLKYKLSKESYANLSDLNNLDRINDMFEKATWEMAKMIHDDPSNPLGKKNKDDKEEVARLEKEKEAATKKLSARLSRLANKCVATISQNKGKIIAAFAASTVAIASVKMSTSKYESTIDSSYFESDDSIDDILDDLL